MKIKVKKTEVYRDGGTTIYKDDSGVQYFEDGRLFSQTKGQVFDKYPGHKDAKRLEVELDTTEKEG